MWQPIETAPKDGTTILVATWGIGPDMASAAWRNGYWDMRHLDGDDDGYPGDRFDREFGNPTHWMPLPEPPDA